MKKSFIYFTILISLFLASCKNNKLIINSLQDLENKKIGVQRGTTGEAFASENIKGSELTVYKTIFDAAEDLRSSVIDAIVVDEYPAMKIVHQNQDFMIIRDKIFEENKEEYAFAVKKGNTELLDSINKTISKIKANGQYDELIKCFFPADQNVTVPKNSYPTAGKALKVGTNAQFFPFEYIDRKDITGFDIILSEYIAQDYNSTLQIVDMNFNALIKAVSFGSIDFIAAAMSITDERKEKVDFSIPYFSSEQVIIIKK